MRYIHSGIIGLEMMVEVEERAGRKEAMQNSKECQCVGTRKETIREEEVPGQRRSQRPEETAFCDG